jgi:hypothetical protein
VLENGSGVVCGRPEQIAEYLLSNPVAGLVMPPFLRFIAGLRERNIDLPLTSNISAIIDRLEEIRRCAF